MIKLGQIEVRQENFKKKVKKKCFSGVIFKNIIVSELIQMKKGFKCLFEDLNDVIGNLS